MERITVLWLEFMMWWCAVSYFTWFCRSSVNGKKAIWAKCFEISLVLHFSRLTFWWNFNIWDSEVNSFFLFTHCFPQKIQIVPHCTHCQMYITLYIQYFRIRIYIIRDVPLGKWLMVKLTVLLGVSLNQ